MLGTAFDLRTAAEKILLLAGILLIIVIFAYIVRKKRHLLKYFIALAILIHIVYMTWRVLYTIPTINAVGFTFGVLLFLAEVIALIQSTTHRLMFMKDSKQDVKSLANLEKLPRVDILIATYNESIQVLRNTVAAAVSQNYPKDKLKVFICDDGRREEVRLLAEEYGAEWSTREKHEHAKAGNLNNCLTNFASGDLFVILDADMIAKSTFLERTVGYFEDAQVAMVQAPQVFYNPDPFQNNMQLYDAIPNEQDFFMREILARRGMYNAVLNVGSNAVFRRSAIDAIGLIPVGTITEDMATSMLLQAKGYKTIFINENLAMGLSPDSFSDYVVQRDRWCRGNIQVLKKWNPLTLPGLSFMQRLIYLDGVLYWFFGLQKIIYSIGPILFLITGIPVYYANVFTMLLFFAPTYYISSLIFTLFDHKNRTYTWAHIYETALAPFLAISALSELFLPSKIKFSVTPKGTSENKSRFAFRIAIPNMVLAIVSFIALGYGIQKMLTDVNYMIPVYMVNIFWLLYNLLGIIAGILVSFEKQRFRAAERFTFEERLLLYIDDLPAIPVEIIDISMKSCAVAPQIPLANADELVGKEVSVCFEECEFKLPAVIYRSRDWGKKIILHFKELNTEHHILLVKFIFNHQLNESNRISLRKSNDFNTMKTVLGKWWKLFILKK